MVRLGRSAFHQLVPHAEWKWNIDETVAVHMADFAVADAEFGAAKTVRSSRDFFPTTHHFIYSRSAAKYRHRFTASRENNRVLVSFGWMRGHIAKLLRGHTREQPLACNLFGAPGFDELGACSNPNEGKPLWPAGREPGALRRDLQCDI